MTRTEFLKLPAVRVWSSTGPCLTHYRIVQHNGGTITVAFEKGSEIVAQNIRTFRVHSEPCPRCIDYRPRRSSMDTSHQPA